jgi:hypothetical protein
MVESTGTNYQAGSSAEYSESAIKKGPGPTGSGYPTQPTIVKGLCHSRLELPEIGNVLKVLVRT